MTDNGKAAFLEMIDVMRDLARNVSELVAEMRSNPLPELPDKGGLRGDDSRRKVRRGRKSLTSYSPEFELFWDAYPKRESKGRAWKYWQRDGLHECLALMLPKIAEQKTTEMWRKDKGQFVPLPATWLNDRGWENETSVEISSPSTTRTCAHESCGNLLGREDHKFCYKHPKGDEMKFKSMTLCPDCSPRDARAAICDFCKHYNFNGDKDGCYVGKGECTHPAHRGPREPVDACRYFYCTHAGGVE